MSLNRGEDIEHPLRTGRRALPLQEGVNQKRDEVQKQQRLDAAHFLQLRLKRISLQNCLEQEILTVSDQREHPARSLVGRDDSILDSGYDGESQPLRTQIPRVLSRMP